MKNGVGILTIFLIGAICSWSFLLANQRQSAFLFPDRFKKLKISSKLFIKRANNRDNLAINLDQCRPKFYLGVSGVKSYYLEDDSKVNKIGVTEYVFKDSVNALKAFELIYAYAEYTRKLCRADYGNMCHPMWTDQVYYASKQGLHIYVYDISYNFLFHSGAESVETNMKNDIRILLDDLYMQMIANG